MSDPYSDYTKLTGVQNRLQEAYDALEGVEIRSGETGPKGSGSEDPRELVDRALRRIEEELNSAEGSMEP